MRRSYVTLILCAFLGLFFLTNASCSKKTGCPVNDPKNTHVKTNRKGELPTKRGRSSVLPPGVKKKKKKG